MTGAGLRKCQNKINPNKITGNLTKNDWSRVKKMSELNILDKRHYTLIGRLIFRCLVFPLFNIYII